MWNKGRSKPAIIETRTWLLRSEVQMPGGRARRVMDAEEGTCYDEHCVLYVNDESIKYTPETRITLC